MSEKTYLVVLSESQQALIQGLIGIERLKVMLTGKPVVMDHLTFSDKFLTETQMAVIDQSAEYNENEEDEDEDEDGATPYVLTDAERFVVASGIGALVAAGAGAPDSVVLSITEKLGLVLNTEQKIGAVAELAAKLVAERK